MNRDLKYPEEPPRDAVMTASSISQPDAGSLYLWVLVPSGIGGATATLAEAWAILDGDAMDQHSGAQAWAIFRVSIMCAWPYVRLIPDAGRTRASHEQMKANVARARLREAERKARKGRNDGDACGHTGTR